MSKDILLTTYAIGYEKTAYILKLIVIYSF